MTFEPEEAGLTDRVVRAHDGTISLRLVPREREILRALTADLREVLGEAPPAPGMSEPEDDGAMGPGVDVAEAPLDPVMRRLYPDAHPDDPGASRRFRDLVGADLAEGRLDRLTTVEGTLDAWTIDDEQAQAWLGVLNDLRLVMGTRLEVTDDSEAEPIDADDPEGAARIVYAYAGWLESQFVDVLAEALPPVPDEDTVEPAGADDRTDPDESISADDS